MPQDYPFVVWRGFVNVFLTVYSFDAVPLIFVFSEPFSEEFTSVSSLIFVVPQLSLKNLPFFNFCNYHSFLERFPLVSSFNTSLHL
jgi:hypothetical protein